jgi:hypothetical protein
VSVIDPVPEVFEEEEEKSSLTESSSADSGFPNWIDHAEQCHLESSDSSDNSSTSIDRGAVIDSPAVVSVSDAARVERNDQGL